MSHLLETLHTRFAKPQGLEAAFMKECGVRVRHSGSLFQFRYDQIAARFSRPETAECRGAILEHKGASWRFVARPFDKFFNLDEGRCPIRERVPFGQKADALSLEEKADGSLIVLWWHPEASRWQVSTMGSIQTQEARSTFTGKDSDKTFADLFEVTSGLGQADYARLDTDLTYLFELCTEESRNLTGYQGDRVFLLAARHKVSGDYIPVEDVRVGFLLDVPGVVVPHRTPLGGLDIRTPDALKLYVESVAREPRFGQWPEGFVVYEGLCPIAKVKNRRYVQRSQVGSSDMVRARNKVHEAFFTATIDDLYPFLSDEMKAYTETLRGPIQSAMQRAHLMIGEFAGADIESPKAFAMAVNARVAKPLRGFFFRNRDMILSEDVATSAAAFDDWLTLNHKKLRFAPASSRD